MRPPQHIAKFILPAFFYLHGLSQTSNIDSLLKRLPLLKDTARIECLHQLSIYYHMHSFQPDSSNYYNDLCLAESKQLQYAHGMAGYYGMAAANTFFGKEQRFKEGELLAREALKWFEKTGNKSDLEVVYWQIGFGLFKQYFIDSAEWFYKKSYELTLQHNNISWQYQLLGSFYENYRDIGAYDKAFDAFEKCQKLNLAVNGHIDTLYGNYVLAELNRRIGNYALALNYYHPVIRSMDLAHENIWYRVSYPELYALAGKFDSAGYYYDQIDSTQLENRALGFFEISKGEFYLLQQACAAAIDYFQKGLVLHREANDDVQINRALLNLAKAFNCIGDNEKAMLYVKEALQLSLLTRSKQYTRDAYEILFEIYQRKQLTDSAFKYYQYYVAKKEEVANDNVKGKFASYDYEQKIVQLDNEKQIQKVTLAKETATKRFLWIAFFGMILVGTVLLRNINLKRKNEANKREMVENELALQKLESDKAKTELQKQAAELEMQALRAQMNPHFIFNSLNSINRFILENNKNKASEYLTKFSRLVRLILQNSQASLINLESELEALQLYLELEAVRFDHHFEYRLELQEDLDISMVKLPPLIIQPYAENAIWHGLMQKETKGLLTIQIYAQGAFLNCKIMDDGIGRKKAAEIKSKSASHHKSMGMQITASRIAMLEKEKMSEEYISINDLVLPNGKPGGTEVILRIPLIESDAQEN